MAYAAVVSLKHTIHRLLNSSIDSSSKEILEFTYVEVQSLLRVLKRQDDNSSNRNKRLNALDGEIREAVYKLEDLLELIEFNQFLPESELQLDLELEEVRQEINSFVEMVKKMEEELVKELDTPCLPYDDRDTTVASLSRDFGVEMVGFSDDLNGIKKKLLKVTRPDDFCIFGIVGRVGSGRTMVAKIIFEESYVAQEQCFDCGAWVTVGELYEWKEILVAILCQVDHPAGSHGELVSSLCCVS